MERFVCITCGTQYPQSECKPDSCLICKEERQYVNPRGQEWTTLEKMRESKTYHNQIVKEENGLYSITTTPSFGIGQTAYLVQGYGFNILWDCITYVDQKTIDQINELGGIDAIALSHPHYYSTQVEWAETFDVPIYVHEDDKQWVMRESNKITYWSGEQFEITPEACIHRLGGHFEGGAVLNWKEGDNGDGVLLTGDIIQVVADQDWVSFMYSYPNLIPLPSSKVRKIAEAVRPLPFNRIYNAFHKIVEDKAHLAVQRSAERYILALEGELFHT